MLLAVNRVFPPAMYQRILPNNHFPLGYWWY
jgi:hypothetical protein